MRVCVCRACLCAREGAAASTRPSRLHPAHAHASHKHKHMLMHMLMRFAYANRISPRSSRLHPAHIGAYIPLMLTRRMSLCSCGRGDTEWEREGGGGEWGAAFGPGPENLGPARRISSLSFPLLLLLSLSLFLPPSLPPSLSHFALSGGTGGHARAI